MPAITDIVTVDGGGELPDAQIWARDCAFPITQIVKRNGADEVLNNMPVYFGYWADGTVQPIQLEQAIDIDTTGVTGNCDAAIVSAALTTGELIAPNMKKIRLQTPVMDIDELRIPFCRMRNISTSELGMILLPGGGINPGNPYAVDFGRFAMSTLSLALKQLLARRILRGDASETYGFDGLYTQLENGWEQGAVPIPDYLNKAIVIDWADMTGDDPATPDSVTLSGKTISLWGEDKDVPAGINLIQLFEDYLFSAIERQWTDQNGGISVYEMHVPPDSKRCYQNASACMQPCGGSGGIWDTDLRARFAELRRRDVVQFYPSMREIPIWESPNVEADTMWIGPREIGGVPTYATFFRSMTSMFAEAGRLGNTYGQGSGPFPENEPLLIDVRDKLEGPFENEAIHWDVMKISMDCVQAGLMTKPGVLATARHLWIKVTGVHCASMLSTILSGVTIDGVPIEGAPGTALITSPANNATGVSTTGNLVATALTGADTYDFQIATDANFNTIVNVVNQASNTYAITPAIAAATAHWWRVRGRNEEGPGAWSATRKFTTA